MRISKEPEARKQEILETAMKLFAEKGYEKTSISDIAKEIGVAQGLCYRYFPSKDILFQTAVNEYANILVDKLKTNINIEQDSIKDILNHMEVLSESTNDTYYDNLSIYILGYIAVYLYLYFTAVLRSFGNTIFQVIAMLISTILNIVLDPIFILKIGFHGAAIATLLSQSMCLIFMIIYIKKRNVFKISFADFDKKEIIPLIKSAVPSVIQQSIPAISTTFLTSLVSTYSISAIAAYGITGKLETILFYPAMAFNMVLTSIVGQCIGAKRVDRAKNYLKLSLKYGITVLFILSILIIIFSKQLAGLFVSSDPVAQIVEEYFIIISIGYVLNTVTNCYLGCLNGMGKPTKSMILMIFYYLVVRIPLAYVFSYIGLGLNGIWIAVLISHIIACITAILTGTHSFKKNIKMEG